MNKDDLVRLLYTAVNERVNGSGLTLKSAGDVYDSMIDAIKKTLYDNEEVRFPSFGRLYVNHSGARTIPHPKVPGQTIEVGPTRQIRLRVFPKTKAELNGKETD